MILHSLLIGIIFVGTFSVVFAQSSTESFLPGVENFNPNWQLSETTIHSDLEISGLSENTEATIRQYAISDEDSNSQLVSTLSIFEFSSPQVALEMLSRNANELLTNDVYILNVTIPNSPNCFGIISAPGEQNEVSVVSCANDRYVIIALSEQNGVIHEDGNVVSTTNISASFVNFVVQNIVDAQSVPIPDWVRNNAKWWSEGAIDDESFIQGLQYMIKEGILNIPLTETASGSSIDEIPQWIKQNAGWWADGQIDDETFISGIQFMIKQGIISV